MFGVCHQQSAQAQTRRERERERERVCVCMRTRVLNGPGMDEGADGHISLRTKWSYTWPPTCLRAEYRNLEGNFDT